MRLIQRTELVYQEGTSDKVYEVDLCEVSPGHCLVNYRYGKRGGTLREGSETPQALPQARAQQVFDKLVASKVKKGYREATASRESAFSGSPLTGSASSGSMLTGSGRLALEPDPSAASEPLFSGDPRHQVILQRLSQGKDTKTWPLTRVIWRAGELRIQAAAPWLLRGLGQGDFLREYSLIWSLGWCGDAAVLPVLEPKLHQLGLPEGIHRITWEAVFKLADPAQRGQLRATLLDRLPAELRRVLAASPPHLSPSQEPLFRKILDPTAQGTQSTRLIEDLYRLDPPSLRPLLLDWLRTVPLRPPTFKLLRHLFKMAEYRQDAEVFGILGYRIDQSAGTFNSARSWIQLPDGSYLQRRSVFNSRTQRWESPRQDPIREELGRESSRLAYSLQTRRYLQGRLWRRLRQLGQDQDPAYVPMAAGILLAYQDGDAQAPREAVHYRWNSRLGSRVVTRRIQWDAYAPYLAFNHILYGHSPRYEWKPGSRAWRCRSPYQPGDPGPVGREESFPDLWTQCPDFALRLLLMSHCQPVHEFAVKVLRDVPVFTEGMGREDLLRLLGSAYEPTIQLACDVAIRRYRPQDLDRELLLALADCHWEPGRQQAHRWLLSQPDGVSRDPALLAGLILSPWADTRAVVRQFFTQNPVPETVAPALVGQVLTALLRLSDSQGAVAREAGEILRLGCSDPLRQVGLKVIQSLLQHPLPEVQAVAAQILLNHRIPAGELPTGLIESLIASAVAESRAVGMQLLGQLPEGTLLHADPLLLSLSSHPLADIRAAVRPLVRRLAGLDPEFGVRLAAKGLQVLLTPEVQAGIHADLVVLLTQDLPGWMGRASREMTLTLLHTRLPRLQELSGQILQVHAQDWAMTFDPLEVMTLANHEILAVRQAAWAMLALLWPSWRQNPIDLMVAVKWLESKWPDSRQLAFQTIQTQLAVEDLTPGVLVGLCDSPDPQVRQLGREWVTRCFQSQDGPTYLLKFSEHPSVDMQLFATHFLEDYARGNLDTLCHLTPYFLRVLGQVNRGRVAKQRVLAFLEQEAHSLEAAAVVVADILTRQSATLAIGDKARCLEIMVRIHRRYPHIPLPIHLQLDPLRSAKGSSP